MNYKYIEMDKYKRKKHFEYFNKLVFPYVGVTVNVDITDFLSAIKKHKLPFFLSLCWCTTKAANRINEFRQRIYNGKIIEFDQCISGHTVAFDDDTYCHCTLDPNKPFHEFIKYAIVEQEKAKKENSIEESETSSLNKYFISCVPRITYTSLINPVPIPADSNPRITRGKFFKENQKTLIPISLLCNHALIDGAHMNKFYLYLNEALKEVVNILNNIND